MSAVRIYVNKRNDFEKRKHKILYLRYAIIFFTAQTYFYCALLLCHHGPSSSSGKALGYGLDGPGVGEVEFFFPLLRVQTGPVVHSDSYKMSTGCFSRR